MKIVYLYTSLTTIGGADRIVIQKANYLADVMGHEVYVSVHWDVILTS